MFKKLFIDNSYIVGGCLRDVILKKKIIKDIDIVCVCNGDEFEEIIKRISRKYSVFPLDEERGIWRFTLRNNLTVDFSRTDDIYSDIYRRDFTINSLAIKMPFVNIEVRKDSFVINFSKKNLIDLTKNGINDLKKGIIRYVSERIFDEDPLRIMRAIRFVSQLNFKIHPDVRKLICEKKNMLSNIAKERIKEELIKMASTNNFCLATKLMSNTGTLFTIFPEFEKQIDCATVYYGKGGVLKHTMNVIEKLDLFFISPEKYSYIPTKIYPKLYDECYIIKLSALFHDIAKPATAAVKGDRLRFFGHENLGSEMTEKYLIDFKFSNREIRYITSIIKNHLRIGSIACNDPITYKAITRVFYDLGEYTLGLLVLSWADYASHISNNKLNDILKETKKLPQPITKKLPANGLRKTIRFMQVVNFLFKNYSKFSKSSNIKPLLNGDDIMDILSIPPGPIIGKIKKKLINLQLDKKIKTRAEAVSYVKSFGKNLSL